MGQKKIMKAASIFLLFAVLASANASPIFKLPHQRAIQEGAADDVQPQPLWIIEAIAEGDLVKVAEIVDQHIVHIIETGKNVGAMWRILARKLIDHIKTKLPKLHISDNLKAKLVEILKRLQGHLAEIERKWKDETGRRFGRRVESDRRHQGSDQSNQEPSWRNHCFGEKHSRHHQGNSGLMKKKKTNKKT